MCNMNTNKIITELEDMKISVKMKLSALWAAVMFCFIYGDIFSLHKPGVIADMMAGKIGPFPVSQETLLGLSLFMADSWTFFIVLGVIEGALLALIVWYAWKWPKQESVVNNKI